MENETIVKTQTEVKISDESVKEILISEIGKLIIKNPDFVNKFIRDILFYRVPKQHSYDSENKTFYESVLKKTVQPMIEEEINKQAELFRPTLRKILRKAFKENLVDSEDFENRLIKQLSKYVSNITFYVKDD